MSTDTMPETETEIIVAPWGIEIDTPRMADVLMQAVPGLRMRSAVDGSKGIKDVKSGDMMVPQDQMQKLGSFPKTPGQQIWVNPVELTYVVSDPLRDDEEMCARITRWVKRNMSIRLEGDVNGVERLQASLDQHRMKNLNREMLWLVDKGDAFVCRGKVPLLVQVNGLPGRYLQNPGARSGWNQPIYEDQMEEWLDRLTRSGD